jgi:hypothetical protein
MNSTLDTLLSQTKSLRCVTDPEEISALLSTRQQFVGSYRSSSGLQKATGYAVLNPLTGEDEESKALSPTALRQKLEALGMPWDDRYLMRTIPYWMSDERVDSMGDIVRQVWDFSLFEKNSPMPWAHNWSGQAVGRVVDWKTKSRQEPDYVGKALYGLGLFALSEQGEAILSLVKSGFLPSGSVGFRPLEILNVTDPDERAKLGLGKYGLVFSKSALLEFSPVLLPANPGAHIIPAGLSKSALDVGYDMVRHQVAQMRSDGVDTSELSRHADDLFSKALKSLGTSVRGADLREDPASDHKNFLTEVKSAMDSLRTMLSDATNVLQDIREALGDIHRTLDKPSNGGEPARDRSSGSMPEQASVDKLRVELQKAVRMIEGINPAE